MLGREHDVAESKLCFNRRLGHDVRYGLVDRVSYTRVPSPMVLRSDKAAARWGLQQVREVVYSNRLPLPKSQQLLPRQVKLSLPLSVIHGRVNLNLRRFEGARDKPGGSPTLVRAAGSSDAV